MFVNYLYKRGFAVVPEEEVSMISCNIYALRFLQVVYSEAAKEEFM